MVPHTYGHVGKTIRFESNIYDFGHAVRVIRFSLDERKNWTPTRPPDTNDYQNLTWTFDWVPKQPGFYVPHVHTVNDKGTASPESAFIEIQITE